MNHPDSRAILVRDHGELVTRLEVEFAEMTRARLERRVARQLCSLHRTPTEGVALVAWLDGGSARSNMDAMIAWVSAQMDDPSLEMEVDDAMTLRALSDRLRRVLADIEARS